MASFLENLRFSISHGDDRCESTKAEQSVLGCYPDDLRLTYYQHSCVTVEVFQVFLAFEKSAWGATDPCLD